MLCVYFFVIYLFKVIVGYSMNKGKMVVSKEGGCCLDQTREE